MSDINQSIQELPNNGEQFQIPQGFTDNVVNQHNDQPQVEHQDQLYNQEQNQEQKNESTVAQQNIIPAGQKKPLAKFFFFCFNEFSKEEPEYKEQTELHADDIYDLYHKSDISKTLYST